MVPASAGKGRAGAPTYLLEQSSIKSIDSRLASFEKAPETWTGN